GADRARPVSRADRGGATASDAGARPPSSTATRRCGAVCATRTEARRPRDRHRSSRRPAGERAATWSRAVPLEPLAVAPSARSAAGAEDAFLARLRSTPVRGGGQGSHALSARADRLAQRPCRARADRTQRGAQHRLACGEAYETPRRGVRPATG